jgi:hypothetical protein
MSRLVLAFFAGWMLLQGAEPASVRVVFVADIGDCTGPVREQWPAYQTGKLPRHEDGVILIGGDGVYENNQVSPRDPRYWADGSDRGYRDCYAQTGWGQDPILGKSVPVFGNHEYSGGSEGWPTLRFFERTLNLVREYGYMAPGNLGYYYFWAGRPRCLVIVVNSEIDRFDEAAGLTMLLWLEETLERHESPCTIVAFHKPLFSSIAAHASPRMMYVWQRIYGRACVVLNGHVHLYERYLLPNGTRQFTVGTGGAGFHRELPGPGTVPPYREIAPLYAHGVLRLEMRVGWYSWQFVGVDERVLDQGYGTCPSRS